MLYNSLYMSYLTYCTEVWGNIYITHLKPRFLRQKKAIRIVNKVKYLEHRDALLTTLNILPLLSLTKLRTAILMFKIYYRKMPPCILDHFTHTSNFYNTRRCDKMLLLKQTRKNKKQMTISCHGIYGINFT